MTTKSKSLKLVVILTLLFLSAAYLLPIYVMGSTSLKTLEEINRRTYLALSANLQFKNFVDVFNTYKMGGALLNSSIISVTVTLLAAFFGGLGGYYLARTRTVFARVLFVMVGIALYLPYQVVIIPLVVIMARTHLALTHWGLILSYLVLNLPLASVLMGTFFLGIPRELEEAAEVDGASRVQTFFQIVTPISLPAYASVAIIIFTQVWNEFFLALTLATPKTQTVQVVLSLAKGSFVANYHQQMAAALISVSIPLLFFLLLGRYFVRGILAGAMKG